MTKQLSNSNALSPQENGSIGGKIRASKLTKEQRQEIAILGSEKRWKNHVLKATHSGVIKIGDKELACAVLENGKRVITLDTFNNAIGRKSRPRKAMTPVAMGLFMLPENLRPFISKELEDTVTPVIFRTEKNEKIYGFNATVLPMLCEAYLKARDHGKLFPNQQNIANTSYLLIRGLAQVGIIALVDEATGYQKERDMSELQKILSQYILAELMPWTRRFRPEFFKQVCKIYGIKNLQGKNTPQYIGGFINKYIYKELPEGVLEELKRLNPPDENGNRLVRHHQFLTEDIGNKHLQQQISAITILMRSCETKEEFDKQFERWKKSLEMDKQDKVVNIT